MEKQSNSQNSRSNQVWTDEDKNLLIQLRMEGLTNQQIANRLRRSSRAIQTTSVKLGIVPLSHFKPWTDEDKSLLKELKIDGLTYEQLANRFGRTPSAVQVMSSKLGIVPIRIRESWTVEEESLLKELKETELTDKQIASQLGRTLDAIKNTNRRMRIVSSPQSPPPLRFWTSDMDTLLGELYDKGLSNKEIGKKINKKTTVIQARLYKIGLRRTSKRKRYKRHETYKLLSLSYFRSIKGGADSRNLQFCITPQDAYEMFIKQDGKCALSGCSIYLNPEYRKGHIQTASLDRIDSTKGYLPNNIQWVHKDINKLKTNFGEKCFRSMCLAVAKTIELDEFNYDDSWEAQQPSTNPAVNENQIISYAEQSRG